MDSFKIGDKVIYPTQGLGVIEDIQVQSYYGETFKIYHLRILSNNTLIMVPSTNTQEIGIRKPNCEKAVKQLLDLMRKTDFDIQTNWKGRYKEHLNLMKSGSLQDMVAVLKSLYYLSLSKPLSFREKKMMEKAKELVVSEMALACSLSPTEIEGKISQALSLCFKNHNHKSVTEF
jgi:CarD family transcriptional regulator